MRNMDAGYQLTLKADSRYLPRPSKFRSFGSGPNMWSFNHPVLPGTGSCLLPTRGSDFISGSLEANRQISSYIRGQNPTTPDGQRAMIYAETFRPPLRTFRFRPGLITYTSAQDRGARIPREHREGES